MVGRAPARHNVRPCASGLESVSTCYNLWTDSPTNAASRQASLLFTMQHLWEIEDFRIQPALISLRHAVEVGSLRTWGGGEIFLFTMHRFGETHYVTFSFLDTLCVLFEIPISRYSLLYLSLSYLIFLRYAVWEKQGSLVTQLPGVNNLGNSLVFGILKKNSNFLTLSLQAKWFLLAFRPKKGLDFDITKMCVFISTLTTEDRHKMLYRIPAPQYLSIPNSQ